MSYRLRVTAAAAVTAVVVTAAWVSWPAPAAAPPGIVATTNPELLHEDEPHNPQDFSRPLPVPAAAPFVDAAPQPAGVVEDRSDTGPADERERVRADFARLFEQRLEGRTDPEDLELLDEAHAALQRSFEGPFELFRDGAIGPDELRSLLSSKVGVFLSRAEELLGSDSYSRLFDVAPGVEPLDALEGGPF